MRDVASAVSIATGLPAYAADRPLGYLAGVVGGKIRPTSPVDAVRLRRRVGSTNPHLAGLCSRLIVRISPPYNQIYIMVIIIQ